MLTVEKEEDFAKVCCEGAHSLCDTLNRRGLNPVKLAYDLRRPDGIAVSARMHSSPQIMLKKLATCSATAVWFFK